MRFNGCFRHVLTPECQISFLSRRSRLCGQSRARRIKLIPDNWNASPSPTPCCVPSSHLSQPTSGKLLPPTCCSPVHPEVIPLFFIFACVLHPVIQRGGELMRPGFLERLVLNCPFCRLSGLAISCHISQVPVVRAGRCHKIRSLWGRGALEFPRQGLDACCAPEIDGKHFPELFAVIIPSSSLCLAASSTSQCQPQYEKSLYADKIQVQRLPSFFLDGASQQTPPSGQEKANRLLKG